jgi:hypothetical protein
MVTMLEIYEWIEVIAATILVISIIKNDRKETGKER